MDYKYMWERMKDWLEEALEEGRDRGFDKEQYTAEGGMFRAYDSAFKEMKRMEGEK